MPESEKTVVVGMTPDALAGTISQAIGDSGGRYDSLPEYFDQMQATLESIDEGVMTIYDAVVDRFASMGGSVAPDGTTGGLAVPFAVPEGADAFSAFLEAVREGVRSANESYALAAEGNESAADAAQRAAESAERVAEGSGAVAEAGEKVAEAGDRAAEASARSARAHGRAAEAAEAAAEAAEQADGPVGRFGEATGRVLARLGRSLSTAAEDIAKSNEELSHIQAQLDELGDGADEARVAELERARRKAEADRLEAEYRVAQVNAQTAYAEGDDAAYRSAMDDVRAARGAYEQASSAYEAEGQPRRSGATTALDWLQYATGDVLDNAPRMWRDVDRGNYGDLANVLGSLAQGAGDLLGGGGNISQKILDSGVGTALSAVSKALPFIGGLATTLGAYGNFMNYWDESNRMAAQYGMQGMPEFALSRAGMGLQQMWDSYTTGLTSEQVQRIQTGLMSGGADFGTAEYQQGYDFVKYAYRNTAMSSEDATRMYVDQVLRGARSVEELTESLETMQEAVNDTTLTFDEMVKMREQIASGYERMTGGDEETAQEVADLVQSQLGLEGVSEGVGQMYGTLAQNYDVVNDSYVSGRVAKYIEQGYSNAAAMVLATQSLMSEGYKVSTDFNVIMRETAPWAERPLMDMIESASGLAPDDTEYGAIREEVRSCVHGFLFDNTSIRFNYWRFRRVLKNEMGFTEEYLEDEDTITEGLMSFATVATNVELGIDSSTGDGSDGRGETADRDVVEANDSSNFFFDENQNVHGTLALWSQQTLQKANQKDSSNRDVDVSVFRQQQSRTDLLSYLYGNGFLTADETDAIANSSNFSEIMDSAVDEYERYVSDEIENTPEGESPNISDITTWITQMGGGEKMVDAMKGEYSSVTERAEDVALTDEENQAAIDAFEASSEKDYSAETFMEDAVRMRESGEITEEQYRARVEAYDRRVSENSGTQGAHISADDYADVRGAFNDYGLFGTAQADYIFGDFVDSNLNEWNALDDEAKEAWKRHFSEDDAFSDLSPEEMKFVTDTLAPYIYAQQVENNPNVAGSQNINVAIDLLGDAGDLFYAIVESVREQTDRDAAKE